MAKKSSAKKSYMVFISHSVEDRWIAKQMAHLIEAKGRRHGIKTFLDEKDIKGGQSITEIVMKNLKECDEFLVLLSQDSIVSAWVLVEIGGALLLDKFIVAIIHKVTPKEMPEVTIRFKALELNDFDQYLEQLLKRIKGDEK